MKDKYCDNFNVAIFYTHIAYQNFFQNGAPLFSAYSLWLNLDHRLTYILADMLSNMYCPQSNKFCTPNHDSKQVCDTISKGFWQE